MYNFNRKAYVDGNGSSENCFLKAQMWKEKQSAKQLCGLGFFVMYFQSPLMQNMFDNCLQQLQNITKFLQRKLVARHYGRILTEYCSRLFTLRGEKKGSVSFGALGHSHRGGGLCWFFSPPSVICTLSNTKYVQTSSLCAVFTCSKDFL